MRRPSLLVWSLLALWSTWLHALQGHLAAASHWAPDLGMVLLVVLAARTPADALPKAGLAVALGRIAVTIDPPAAVLVGIIMPMLVFGGLRSVVVIREGVARAGLAALGSVLLALWLALVHEARSTSGSGAAWFEPRIDLGLWRTALATGVAAFVLGPVLAVLPGVAPLMRRRPWEVAASSH